MPQAALFFRTQPLDQSIAKRIYTLSHIDKFYYAPLYALYKPIINAHFKVFASRLVSTFTFYTSSPSTMASPTLLPRRRNPYGLLWWIVPVGVGVLGMRELFIVPFSLIFSTLPFRRLNPYIPFLWFIPVGIYVFWQPFILHFMSNSSVAPFLFCSCFLPSSIYSRRCFPRCLFGGEIRTDYFCGLCPWTLECLVRRTYLFCHFINIFHVAFSKAKSVYATFVIYARGCL